MVWEREEMKEIVIEYSEDSNKSWQATEVYARLINDGFLPLRITNFPHFSLGTKRIEYSFGDNSSLPKKSKLEGRLKDLKLKSIGVISS